MLLFFFLLRRVVYLFEKTLNEIILLAKFTKLFRILL